jgi:hypothetical protein
MHFRQPTGPVDYAPGFNHYSIRKRLDLITAIKVGTKQRTETSGAA